MRVSRDRISLTTQGQALYELTEPVQECISRSATSTGLCVLFVPHTSAGLVVQERADPTSRADLQSYIDAIVDKDKIAATHLAEGPDDSASHMKAALTGASIVIPIEEGRLELGQWQGVFLWEHRVGTRERSIIVKIIEWT